MGMENYEDPLIGTHIDLAVFKGPSSLPPSLHAICLSLHWFSHAELVKEFQPSLYQKICDSDCPWDSLFLNW